MLCIIGCLVISLASDASNIFLPHVVANQNVSLPDVSWGTNLPLFEHLWFTLFELFFL